MFFNVFFFLFSLHALVHGNGNVDFRVLGYSFLTCSMRFVPVAFCYFVLAKSCVTVFIIFVLVILSLLRVWRMFLYMNDHGFVSLIIQFVFHAMYDSYHFTKYIPFESFKRNHPS